MSSTALQWHNHVRHRNNNNTNDDDDVHLLLDTGKEFTALFSVTYVPMRDHFLTHRHSVQYNSGCCFLSSKTVIKIIRHVNTTVTASLQATQQPYESNLLLWQTPADIQTSHWTSCFGNSSKGCPQIMLYWSHSHKTAVGKPWRSSSHNHQHHQHFPGFWCRITWLGNWNRQTPAKKEPS